MRRRGWLGWAILLGGIVAAGVFFFPARLGGDMYYVMLTGPSMEPHFHLGDLVLVRRAAVYQPGDVALYRHPRIGFVFHRIVGFDNQGRFRFKGDNNGWEDPYHPPKEAVYGRYVFRIPYAGKVLQWLRKPWFIALLVVLIALLLFAPRGPDDEEEPAMSGNESLRDWMVAFGALALLAAILGMVAWTRPAYEHVKEPIPYTHSVSFTYTARAPEGLYDLPQVQPGEPIFTQLMGTLKVGCAYRFTSAFPYQIHGTYQLLAQVSDATGWKRTLALTKPVDFQNGTFQAEAVLHVDDVRHLIDEYRNITGIHRNTFTLAVIAEIQTAGTVGEVPLQEAIEPALHFRWDGTALVLLNPGAPPGAKSQDPFHQVYQKSLIRQHTQPNSLVIFGARLPVPVARWIAVVIGLLALIALGWTWYRSEQAATEDPVARLRLLYGVTVVPVQDVPETSLPLMEVENMDALAMLAESHRAPVLASRSDEGKVDFWLQTSEALYHYADAVRVHAALPRPPAKKPFWRFLPGGARSASCEDDAVWDVVLGGWAQAVDAQSVGDPHHSRRVADLAEDIGKAMGMPENALKSLRLAAWLHALGLMDVPSDILHKHEPLTEEERRLLQEHAQGLNERFSSVEALRDALRIAYYRSEHWDGSGYPEGLSGEAIPVEARVLAVADAWDALRHDRPYRKAWPEEAALRFLRQKAGVWFDPAVVDALAEVLGVNAEEADAPMAEEEGHDEESHAENDETA